MSQIYKDHKKAFLPLVSVAGKPLHNIPANFC